MRNVLLFMALVAQMALLVPWWQARPGKQPVDQVDATMPDVTSTARTLLPSLPPLARFSQTRRRPLFERDRGPPSPAVPLAQPHGTAPARASAPRSPPVPAPLFTLRAVAITPAERFALLRDSRTGRSAALHVGGQFGGWRLTGIAPRQVVVAKDGTARTVKLRRFAGTRVPTHAPTVVEEFPHATLAVGSMATSTIGQ